MTREEILAGNRKEFIGGSDIASILGVGWRTPLQVWAEKTGLIEPKDISNVEAVQLGVELEDFIAHKFEKATGKKVRRLPDGFRYTHKKYPFMRCQIDRIIEGKDENLECKNVGEYRKDEWKNDEMPQEVICQVQWGLMITGREIGNASALIGGNKHRFRSDIKADKELHSLMEDRAVDFWENYVLKGVAPVATSDDGETLLSLYPKEKSEEYLEDESDIDEVAALRQELDMHIKQMTEQKKEIENKLKLKIGDKMGIRSKKYFVTWREQACNGTYDKDAMIKDGVFTKYYKAGQTRVLRITKNKGE